MNNQYDRLKIMLEDKLEPLQDHCILVVGIGGVGSFAVESLARCGFKRMVIVDNDVVDITNLNRQLIALHSTLNQPKVEVMKQRIFDINPLCEIKEFPLFLDVGNIDLVFSEKIDFVIDACDTIATKLLVIEHCLNNDIAFISSMGAANKVDATKVEVVDLTKTYNDPLAKIIRGKVKQLKLKGKIPVVFSSELPNKPTPIVDLNVTSRKELPLLGSNAFVPSTFGLVAANYCFNYLVNKLSNIN